MTVRLAARRKFVPRLAIVAVNLSSARVEDQIEHETADASGDMLFRRYLCRPKRSGVRLRPFVVAPIVIAALALSEYYLPNRSIADLLGGILPEKVGGTILKPVSVKPAHFSGSAA